MHFTKTFNQNDFVDVILKFANKNNFKMQASVYGTEINPLLPAYEKDYIAIHSLNIQHGYLNLFRGAIRLSRLMRLNNIAILHTHHFYESIIGMMACILYPKSKLIIGRHYHNEFYITAAGIKLKYYLFFESLANKFAERIISPSSLINELLVKQGVPEKKISYIPYGFNFSADKYQKLSPSEIEFTKLQMQLKGSYLVGNFSRHHRIKGQDILFKAFKRLLRYATNIKLVMVGDGPYNQKLKELAVKEDIHEHVIFLGFRTDASMLMKIMDVIVHPTLQEAFPQVMIEAMALEKPLIISSVSGVTDVVKTGHNAICVPSGNEDMLFDAMKKCWSEQHWAAQIGINAGAYVRSHLEIEHIIKKFERLYTDVVTHK